MKNYEDGSCLLYIDRHLVHEVTSPQAFEAIEKAGQQVRRPDLTLAVPDHNVATTSRTLESGEPTLVVDRASALQLDTLRRNAKRHRITIFDTLDPRQGIVHVVGPEQGFTLPGSTLVCGDSHTSTHGALGALAFGIGTSEIHHVLATQTLRLRPSKTIEIRLTGQLGFGVTSKDVALTIISTLGAAGGSGSVIEYRGDTFDAMSIEERLTVANMFIEAGARAGLFAPDEKTFEYLRGRPMAPQGRDWDAAVAYWKTLRTDEGAVFDRSISFEAGGIAPNVTWGTSPDDVVPITGRVPRFESFDSSSQRERIADVLAYMGLSEGQAMQDIRVDHVFIGSCTNGRIEDLRLAACVLKGRRVAASLKQALVVPGSGLVKRQAEHEGLDRIFREAGFEWREPGCSACLGMNP